jgi:hypothetical protein
MRSLFIANFVEFILSLLAGTDPPLLDETIDRTKVPIGG